MTQSQGTPLPAECLFISPLDLPIIASTSEVAFFVPGLQHPSVLYNNTDSPGELYALQKALEGRRQQRRIPYLFSKLKKRTTVFDLFVRHFNAFCWDVYAMKGHSNVIPLNRQELKFPTGNIR